MSSMLRPKKKKVLSAKKVWKGITNTPRACLDTVVRYIRRPKYPGKLCFFSGRSQEKRGIIFMQEEEQRPKNPSSRIMIREEEKMEGINATPEAASSSVSANADDSIFDDSTKRYNYREENSLHDAAAGTSVDDDSIFEDFIQRNRERFRLEKENSLERLNYYALWPYYAYFDPDY